MTDDDLDLSPHLEPEWRDSVVWAVEAVGLFHALYRITGKRWTPVEERAQAEVVGEHDQTAVGAGPGDVGRGLSISQVQRAEARREAREGAENLDRLKRKADEWIARQQPAPETSSDASELLADTTPTVHPAIAEAA